MKKTSSFYFMGRCVGVEHPMETILLITDFVVGGFHYGCMSNEICDNRNVVISFEV